MPSPKFEITNPVALKFIADVKSGVFFAPYKAKLFQYRWHIISVFVVICLIIALAIGKSIASRTPADTFTPPDIVTPNTPTPTTIKSKYEPLRQEIIYFNTDLPDPGLPPFDNVIDLEIHDI